MAHPTTMPAIAPALRVVAAFASTASVEVGVGLEEEVGLEGRFAVVVEEVAEEVCEVVLAVIEVELGTLFTLEGAELVATDVESLVDEGVDLTLVEGVGLGVADVVAPGNTMNAGEGKFDTGM